MTAVEPSMQLLARATAARPGLSFHDRVCLLLAKENRWTCVTNDGRLRRECQREHVSIRWGLELLVDAVQQQVLAAPAAAQIGRLLREASPGNLPHEILDRFLAQVGQTPPQRLPAAYPCALVRRGAVVYGGCMERNPSVDLERLLRLRLAVARFGELDLSGWWNTKGQLGALGSAALRRGFPRTHHFAQARAVFAVAAHRCSEVFDPPRCVTLWRLPEAIEEEFDARWEHWVDHADEWRPFFERIELLNGVDLVAILRSLDLVAEQELATSARLRRSAEGRAVPLPGVFTNTDEAITLLALGFARGEPGVLAVPYARRENA